MLIVKSKYRIARRLGAAIFDQTQTQKFALREQNRVEKKRGRAPSDFGKQLLEKQRVRFTYGISERQLSNYVQRAIATKDPSASLHVMLETRADNVVYRSGLASTRRGARQMVSHGHIKVNGTRTMVPSHELRKNDVISVRDGSKGKSMFAVLAEKNPEGRAVPQWIDIDVNLLTVKVTGEPSYSPIEAGYDYATVFEFYSR